MRSPIGQVKKIEDLKYAPVIDELNTCFIDQKGHFYRQENNRVLHVDDGIVNLLSVNAINDLRINWDYVFSKIPSECFEGKLQEVLQSFYK